MPIVRRVFGTLAALAIAVGLVAVASPAQAQSRSTWCSDWQAAGSVATVGRLAERTCVQVFHPDSGKAQVRAVAEVRITPVAARLRHRPVRVTAPTASPSVSVTAPAAADGIVVRNIHQTPGDGLTTTVCRFREATYSDLADGEPLVLSCFSPYVEQQRGTARIRTWATVTDASVTTNLALTGYFPHTFS